MFLVSDFELAEKLGWETVFPQVKVVGCNFHFCQMIRGRVQSEKINLSTMGNYETYHRLR